MMRRKIYQELLQWKSRQNKKPLLVIGARQVGKTYTISQFCQAEYKRSTIVNLLERTDIVDLFKERDNAEDKFKKLKILLNSDLEEKDTILFVDEVQESEEFISNLKFIYEKYPKVNIICAGSLLGVKLKRFKSSFPVGKVDMLDMFPMNFKEFLYAFQQDLLIDEIQECFNSNKQLSTVLHNAAMSYYRLYLCIGGLPEAVKDLVSLDKDLIKFDKNIIINISESYLADMHRYVINNTEALKIIQLYDSLPSQLANKSSKFQYSKIIDGAKSRGYETPLSWLLAARLVFKSRMVTTPQIPLAGYVKNDYFKLFVSDVGILSHSLKLNFADIITDNLSMYKGEVTENYVATELNSLGIPLFYWKSDRIAEVDFLLSSSDGIIPIEVKASDSVQSKSIEIYNSKFKQKYSIRISTKNFGFENDIKSIPLYAVFCLESIE